MAPPFGSVQAGRVQVGAAEDEADFFVGARAVAAALQGGQRQGRGGLDGQLELFPEPELGRAYRIRRSAAARRAHGPA